MASNAQKNRAALAAALGKAPVTQTEHKRRERQRAMSGRNTKGARQQIRDLREQYMKFLRSVGSTINAIAQRMDELDVVLQMVAKQQAGQELDDESKEALEEYLSEREESESTEPGGDVSTGEPAPTGNTEPEKQD